MKSFILSCTLVLSFFATIHAQTYKNEWIDYNKIYYKFKVGPFGFDAVNAPIRGGIVRIYQPALAAAGLSEVPSEQFQLFTNGEEVPLYVSKSYGPLTSQDFIEFWGKIPDGKLDRDLYKDSTFYLADKWSLSTDSASYFLTRNTSGSNLRFRNTANNVEGTTLTPDANFMYTVGRYYRSYLNNGYGVFQEKPLFLSSYERGEGFSSRSVSPNNCGCSQTQLPQYFTQLKADATSGLPVTVRINMVGNALNNRTVKVFLNNDSIGFLNMGYFQSAKPVYQNISSAKLTSDSALIVVQNLCTITSDEMKVIQTEVTYPRKFNFNNASDFEFLLPSSPVGRFLKITNFNDAGSVPVLYDLLNGRRYVADKSLPGTLQFVLSPSSNGYQLVLVRGDGSYGKNITTLTPRIFTNYSDAANQGNFLIISNAVLLGSESTNYLEQYKDYRNSVQGGGYAGKIYLMQDLEDQFAWGIKFHPLAIKNFLRYARNNFSTPPLYAFLVGKGISYNNYRLDANNPVNLQTNLVPTYGSPGSDNLLSADGFSDVPATPIGRLSVVNVQEIGDYLVKVKEYEKAQHSPGDSIENKKWMKKVLHLTGANDASLGGVLDNYIQTYTTVVRDTLFGGNVTSYSKSANPSTYPDEVVDFTRNYNEGSGLLQYFGHSSSSSIDFSLDDPNNYKNTGRYPVFIVNGCLAGNIFDFEQVRKTNLTTLSEKFVLAPQKGSIAYLSTSSYGVVSYLDIFTKEVYNSLSITDYGKGMGDITKRAFAEGLLKTGTLDFYGRMHAQQYTLHGDPALKLNNFGLPDYAVQANYIQVNPGYISPADTSFSIKVRLFNLGKATSDSVHFTLTRVSTKAGKEVVFSQKLPYINSEDSLVINIPIIPNRDIGKSTYTAMIDDELAVTETTEKNNKAEVTVKVAANDIKPVHPYNYSIVTADTVSFAVSTAYALLDNLSYLLEVDTTALFNSRVKIKRSVNSAGGIIQFEPINIPKGTRVYYWRIAAKSTNPHWNVFSFIHKEKGADGFEQQHFYQHTNSDLHQIALDTTARQFKFADKLTNLFVLQSIYPTSGIEDGEFSVTVNGSYIGKSACVGSSIVFNVLDPVTFRPITNKTNPYGAASPCAPYRENNFEYSTQTSASRKNAMDFLDNYVQQGYYVVARKIYDLGNADWAPTVWAKDTALYGSGNSLYHRFKDQGCMIDSFTYPRTFVFIFKKNDSTTFKPVSTFTKGLYDRLSMSENIQTTDTIGVVTSPKFGPALKWNKVQWVGKNSNKNNRTNMDVIAVDLNGNDTLFYSLDKFDTAFSISSIKAAKYPYIKLRMQTRDSLTANPYQLSDWMVTGEFVPEGAMAPNLGVQIPEKLNFDHPANMMFDTLSGFVVFKNTGASALNPLKVKFSLTDLQGKEYRFPFSRTRALPAGDTLQLAFKYNLKSLEAGMYNLIIEVNPDNDQPEQFHYNNLLYKYIYITRNEVKNLTARSGNTQTIQDLGVYPSPFKNTLNISASNRDGRSTFNLYNMDGKVMYHQVFTFKETLDVSSLLPGMYVAEIISGNTVKKVMVEKLKK